jgi:aspartate aminotransferase
VYGGKVKNSSDLAIYLLEEAKVALVQGDAFGNDNHVRISYAVSMEDIKKALERIEAALKKV